MVIKAGQCRPMEWWRQCPADSGWILVWYWSVAVCHLYSLCILNQPSGNSDVIILGFSYRKSLVWKVRRRYWIPLVKCFCLWKLLHFLHVWTDQKYFTLLKWLDTYICCQISRAYIFIFAIWTFWGYFNS